MENTVKISEIVERLRIRFKEGLTFAVDFRIRQLNCLKQMVLDNRDDLVESVRKDFKKPMYEIYSEIDYSIAQINFAIKNIHNWMAPTNLPKYFINMVNTTQVRKEPLGVVLVMSPWNYPILLPMLGLIGAIAAGNCVMVKPSEISSNISLKLQQLIHQYLSNGHYAVVCGGADVATEVLKEKFEHILYIGSEKVGKIVMEAAAKHLTPVTLELGGKCPCYVDKNCDLELAAKKIAWIKTMNAGQICISVDYVLCHQEVQDRLVELIKKYWHEFYGENPATSEDYGRIISQAHYKRIMQMLNDSKGNILIGGEASEKDSYISPTLITNINEDDSLMSDEIFGPILPIITVENSQEAVKIIQNIKKPLVVYAITTCNEVVELLSDQTSSGQLIVNEIYGQFLIHDFPFGGVGNSGFGKFLGKETFNTFSNSKSFFRKKYYMNRIENVPLPPMTQRKYDLIKWCL